MIAFVRDCTILFFYYTAAKNVIRVVLLFCILLVFYLFGKMSAILHRNPKFALFEKFFSRLERKEFWLSKHIQIWQGDYKIAKTFQSMLVRNASFDAIDLGLICPCYSGRSIYRTRAIISRGLYNFYPIFSAIYNQERLILQTICVLNKER